MKIENKKLKRVVDVIKDGKSSTKSFGWTPETDEEYQAWKAKEDAKKKETREKRDEIMKEARMPWFCPECGGIMNTKMDTKMYNTQGKCFDCVVKEEHNHRVNGTFELYQQEKMISNGIAQLKAFREKFEEALQQTTTEEFVHESGWVEKWQLPDGSLDKVKEEIKKDIQRLDENIEELQADREKVLEKLNKK